MELFAHCEREPERLLAVTEAGERLTLGDLNAAAQRFAQAVGGHRLVFLLCGNTPGSLLGYLSCLRTGAVPLLLDAQLAPALLGQLLACYHPPFVYVPQDLPEETRTLLGEYCPVLELAGSALLRAPAGPEPELHPDLALLLTTSGSTGSAKLVRISGKNLDANARSIADYLRLTEHERPITSLAMNYSYGMSILNSHLLVGAPVVLTSRSVLERPFWDLVVREGVTSLAGVPYTYQMLRRAGMVDMELPSLQTLTQAGGKLPEALHQLFAAWAAETGRRFYVMYGQTEASPRMGYLPPERAVDKCGSMGIPIPGGTFRLLMDDGSVIAEPDCVGELVYQGENVAMGYAQGPEELCLGDLWGGELHTGDLAKRDEEGFYYIVGRKSRFMKLYGSRVNLDEVERLLTAQFPEAAFACVGLDDSLSAFYEGGSPSLAQEAAEFLQAQLRFPLRSFHLRPLEAIPRSSAGKPQYAVLQKML